MTSLSFPVLAEAADVSLNASIEVRGKTVIVTGDLSNDGERLVSIFVLPNTVNGTEMSSIDAMLALREQGLLYQNVIYMNSVLNSAENGYTFEFRVPAEGEYRIFMDSPGANAFQPVYLLVKGILDYLDEAGNDFDKFKTILLENITETEATMLDTFEKLSPEQKDAVALYVFESNDRPYTDKNTLSDNVDEGIQSVLDALLNDIKANVATPENIIELIQNNQELIGVTKIDVYQNELDDNGRLAVKNSLSAAAPGFTSLDDCKTCFDNAVVAAAVAKEQGIMNLLNTSTTPAEFGEKLLLNKTSIGLFAEQMKLIERLSDSMLNTLYGGMMQDGDTNGDGLSDFAHYTEITESFDNVINGIGTNAIALDIINNRENSEEIIEILYEYESVLIGLNKAGYEQLKDGENVYYQQAVIKAFLAGNSDATIGDVVTRFNGLIEVQKNAKIALDNINNANFTTLQTIIRTKYSMLGIDEEVYSDYLKISEKSSSKLTDLINAMLMYKPYENPGIFAEKFKTQVSNIKNSLNSSSAPSGGGSGQDIGTKVEEYEPSYEEDKTVAIFNDLASVSWAEKQILYLADRGIVNGKGNNHFDPNGYVTREEFVKMLVTAFNIHNVDAHSGFGDSDSAKWYDSYIASAANKGIVKGDNNGNFGVGENITREDMSVLVYRTLQSEKSFDVQSMNVLFADHTNISDYAVEGIYALKKAGYINGMGNNMFAPKNSCTRAEAAVIIYNVIQ